MKDHVCTVFVLMALLLPTTFGAKPTFEPAAQIPAAILDDSPPGTFYYRFTAKDPQSLNIIYSLDNNIQKWLQINPDTGNTTVKKKIDREAITIVKFKVFATNTNNEKAELETFLIITDVNNKPPIMTNVPYTKNIAEDTPIGTTVYTITIDDKDDGLFAETVLTINSGNEAGAFRLKHQNIFLNYSLDYDNGVRQYVLNITAKNTQPPFPETSGVITINVLNVDDQGLKFLQNIYEGQVIKGSSVNTPIVQVQAKDLDSLNETIKYKIYPDSDPENLYAINTDTGQITVNAGLEIGSQMLVVMAVSRKHGSVVTLVNVTVVAVLNVQFQASIVEGQANTVVMDLTTTETSFNVTGASFSIESGNNGNHFEIETTNLKVGSIPLDRQTRSDYSLVIKLTKGGVVQGMATVNVIVKEDLSIVPPKEPPSIDVLSIQLSSAVIIWTRPVYNGGSPVTGYKILVNSTIIHINTSNVLLHKEITGLHDDTVYEVKVLARNIAGYGNASSNKVFKTGKQDIPRVPLDMDVVSIQPSSAVIIWTRPVYNGGSPVTGYKILVNSTTIFITTSNVLLHKEITGLHNDTFYEVKVLARNIAGYSDASSKVFKTSKQGNNVNSPTTPCDSCYGAAIVGVLAFFLSVSFLLIIVFVVYTIWQHNKANSEQENPSVEMTSPTSYSAPNGPRIGMTRDENRRSLTIPVVPNTQAEYDYADMTRDENRRSPTLPVVPNTPAEYDYTDTTRDENRGYPTLPVVHNTPAEYDYTDIPGTPDKRETSQDNYQQLNPATLQYDPTVQYEPLRTQHVTSTDQRNDTYEPLRNQPAEYQSLQRRSYVNITASLS